MSMTNPIDAAKVAMEVGLQERDVSKRSQRGGAGVSACERRIDRPIDGTPIGRDAWEQAFSFAVIAARQSKQKGGR